MAKKKHSAGLVIYSKNDGIEFLLLRNTLKNTYWEFPKGKIEKGESVEEAAKRESREETNLNNFEVIPNFEETISWYYRRKGETINKVATFILAKIPVEDKNKVKINKEHEDFKWLSYEDAMNLIKIKNNKKILKKAHNKIKEYEGIN